MKTLFMGRSPWDAGGAHHAFALDAAPRRGLGETEQTWFARAKAAVAKYDGLVARAERVAKPDVRGGLLARFRGDPSDAAGALYRRNSVAYNVAEAESFTPVNYLVFRESRAQNRVEKLEDWNRGFGEEVAAAERAYGVLPEPVVVERVVEAEKEAGIPVPLLAAAGLALVGLGFLVFGGR